ncbi:xanthine dehydrogenase [Aureococcus anophagefferens]|nr:xanthine dehydrogenase [Aureococcus anophagefferens]
MDLYDTAARVLGDEVTGEARYTDDQPAPAETLHACLVLAGKVGAIRGVDMVKARVMPGAAGVFSAADLPKCAGANDLGAIVHDEECFATEFAPYPGQVVAIAAIAAGSYYEMTRHFVASAGWDGDAFLDEPADGVVVVEGEVRVGAQEHFYLECNTTLVDPTDDGGLKVLTSTQAVAKTQACVARVCGLPMHRVVATCKRMGGGFGGKETRSVFASCACALAAKLLQKPVRLSLERDADMRTTGMRHAFLGRYRAAVDAKTLKFVGLDVQLYSNGGASLDLSGPVLDRALLHGMVVTEHVVEHLAHALGHGDRATLYGRRTRTGEAASRTHAQPIASCAWRVPRCVARVKETSGYDDRAAVAAFNTTPRTGCLAPCPQVRINFTAKLLNQGGSLVHLYTDGTLLVSHGGTEMGQGLHTKVCQVVAQAFGVAIDRVHVEDTASDKLAAVAGDAFFNRIDLSAHGFAVDGARCGYDWDRPNGDRGMPFNYWTQGAAVAEVELDCLTGDFEGAGWLTTEELIVSEAGHGEDANHAWFGAPPGTLLTNGPGNYKLRPFNDARRRVELSTARTTCTASTRPRPSASRPSSSARPCSSRSSAVGQPGADTAYRATSASARPPA